MHHRRINFLMWPKHLPDPLIRTILPEEKWVVFIQPDQNSHQTKNSLLQPVIHLFEWVKLLKERWSRKPHPHLLSLIPRWSAPSGLNFSIVLTWHIQLWKRSSLPLVTCNPKNQYLINYFALSCLRAHVTALCLMSLYFSRQLLTKHQKNWILV